MDLGVHGVEDFIERSLSARSGCSESNACEMDAILSLLSQMESKVKIGALGFTEAGNLDIRSNPPRKERPMTESSNIERIRRRIPFTIDGQPFTTDDLSQRASALLRLAGLDPVTFDLGSSWGRSTLRRSASLMTRSSPLSRTRGSYQSARAHRSPNANGHRSVHPGHDTTWLRDDARGRAGHLQSYGCRRCLRWKASGYCCRY